MPSSSVDGMDVIKTHYAMAEAAAHIRSGKGPYLLEINTYRYRGHSVSDPAKYRTIMPNFFVSEDQELKKILTPLWEDASMPDVERHGASYWIQIGD
jgi:TPP-dependent pyruvate/acetoin dehydrogenase alpha subunit